jgi:hypothetical protein
MTDLQNKRLEKFIQERDTLHVVIETFTQSPTEEAKLFRIPAQAQYDSANTIIQCIEEGKPFIASWYACSPEIYTAMALPWYSLTSMGFTNALSPDILAGEIDGSGRLDPYSYSAHRYDSPL